MKARTRHIWMVALGWLAVICTLSGSAFGYKSTGGFLERSLRLVWPAIPYDLVNLANTVLRKSAHVGLYTVLAMLALSALPARTDAAPGGGHRVPWAAALRVLLLVLLCALFDEFHQIFEPGRGPGLGDVLWDFSGGLLGLIVWARYRQRKC